MSWSVKVLTVRGIPIRVHASFLLVVLWAAWIGLEGAARGSAVRSAGFMVLFVLLLFLCVVLHELGHSLVAQAFGVKVHDITLWPVGGVARLAEMPKRPSHEFLITAAGPTVNLVLAAVLGVLAFSWIGPTRLLHIFATGRGIARLLDAQTGQSLVLLLALQNLVLAIFNLIPAFPMDGGRLLRSILAAFLPFRTATLAASFVGQGLALVLLGVSFLPPANLFLTFIAAFVFLAAWQERRQVAALENLAGLTVRDAMQPLGVRLRAQDGVRDVIRRQAATPQGTFIVEQDGRLAGLITRGALLDAGRKARPDATVGPYTIADVTQLGPDEPLVDVQERLQEAHAAVVVENGGVVGLVTQADVARLSEALEALPRTHP